MKTNTTFKEELQKAKQLPKEELLLNLINNGCKINTLTKELEIVENKLHHIAGYLLSKFPELDTAEQLFDIEYDIYTIRERLNGK